MIGSPRSRLRRADPITLTLGADAHRPLPLRGRGFLTCAQRGSGPDAMPHPLYRRSKTGIWNIAPPPLASSPGRRRQESDSMRFGLFGSAAARRGSGEFDSAEGYRDFIEYNVEAEALGFHGTFVVEHHFTGFGQVSATLNLLTWLGARTRTLAARHRGDRAALAQSGAAGRASGDAGSAVRRTAGFRHRQGLPLQRIRRLHRADGRSRRPLRGSHRA